MSGNSLTLGFGQFFGIEEFRRDAGGFSFARMIATKPAEEVPDHSHDSAHLILVLAGRYASRAEPLQPCRATALVYNPPGVCHADHFRQSGGVFFSVSVSDRRHQSAGATRLPARALAFSSGPAVRLARALYGTCARWGAGSRARTEALGMGLLTVLLDDAAACRPKVPAWLRAVRDALSLRLAEPLRVSALADEAGVHAVHLIREFRRFYGTTPHTFRIGRRLDTAVTLLTTTRLPLAEIALRTGFADQSHFTRVFKHRHGIAPATWRRRATSLSGPRLISDKISDPAGW